MAANLGCLQSAPVNDLVVNGELTALIVDDENPDAATAVVEGILETAEEAALVKDRQALLDVTSLGHGDDAAVVTDVEDAVLLEDWAKHVLDDHRRRWVGDEGRLLVELLGEEVNTEVAVLASLGGGGNSDDLARAALEDQKVANADVVAWDGDGVRESATLSVADRLATWGRHGDLAVLNDNVVLAVGTVVVMVVLSAVNGV